MALNKRKSPSVTERGSPDEASFAIGTPRPMAPVNQTFQLPRPCKMTPRPNLAVGLTGGCRERAIAGLSCDHEIPLGTSSDGPNLLSGPCRIKLNVIVGRLQATYDLSGD
jgi:hypothetical protein